jgi:hypothetical protein
MVGMRILFSTTLGNINKFFSFFGLDLLQNIFWWTSVPGYISQWLRANIKFQKLHQWGDGVSRLKKRLHISMHPPTYFLLNIMHLGFFCTFSESNWHQVQYPSYRNFSPILFPSFVRSSSESRLLSSAVRRGLIRLHQCMIRPTIIYLCALKMLGRSILLEEYGAKFSKTFV